jgi:hypothetical protein
MIILLNIVACLVVFVLVAHFWSASSFERYVKRSMAQVRSSGTSVGKGAEESETLPSIIQQFIVCTGVSVERAPQSVHLLQTAELRMSPDKPWQRLNCEQVISLKTPGFVWYADQTRGAMSMVRVIDAFIDGHGCLQARLLGSIPVARFSGPEADRSELMRYLAELAWAPDAAIHNAAIRWRTVSDKGVELEADSNGGLARVRLYFNTSGDIVEMQADARGSTENGIVVPRPWRGVYAEHREMGGRRIPTYAEVGYVYDDGYAAYWRGRITNYRLE